jgi:trehalose monomycolate/heme transporter
MLKRLGFTLYRFRRVILLLTILIAVIMAYYGLGVFGNLQGASIIDPTSESSYAQQLIAAKFSNNAPDVVVLLSNSQLQASDERFQQATLQLQNALKALPEVVSVSSYYTKSDPGMVSRDGHEVLLLINLSAKNGGKTSNYQAIAPLLTSPTLHVEPGGPIVSDLQFNAQIGKDLQHAELITLPITVLLLFLIFDGLVAALLPLLIGVIAILGSFAVLHVLVNFTEITSFAVDVVAFIGLGLAIDYSLFIITRFREELALNEQDVQGGLGRTLASAGRTILFSGLTVGISLLCLLIFPEVLLRSISLAAISATLIAMLSALIVLPALLAMLGRRVNAISVRRLLRRKTNNRQTKQGAWYQLAHMVMRWPIPVAVGIIGLVLLLGTPFLGAAFSTPDERSLPAGSSARIVQEQLKQNFVDQGVAEIDIVITTPGSALSADNLAGLNTYVTQLKAISGITSVLSLTTIDPQLSLQDYQRLYAHPLANPQIAQAAVQLANGKVTEVIVTTNALDLSDQAETLVNKIRDVAVPAGFTRLVGGDSAAEVDLFNNLKATIPIALLIMAGAIFILLFLLTGSLIMPIKALILNFLSLSATLGALVWGFQDGHLQNILGFQPIGSLDSTQTVLIFALAFALSMDYEVFLLSRIREQYDLLHNNREAVAIGLQRTGWLITSAALVLAVVIGAFAISKIIFIQELGIGVALAILMDATLIRSLLVPAMMSLLGPANWWAPRPLKALWLHIGLRESEGPLAIEEKQAVCEESEVPSEVPLAGTRS